MADQDQVYAPLHREPTLANRATLQLQSLILGRAFQPGDRLPSERELGERLGVSRTVVREALRTLSTKGLVEVRDGAGAYVRAPSTDLVSELLGICVSHMDTGDVTSRNILEMRRILEIEMSGLAAERGGADDLATLDRLLGLMARPGSSREDWAKIDYEFHDAVAIASKNPLFPIVLRSISEVLMRARLLGVRLPDYQAKALHHHRNVYEAIRARSPEKARTAMADHLREAEQTMRRVLSGEAEGPQTRSADAQDRRAVPSRGRRAREPRSASSLRRAT
jgi:GntR family transcriptional regulator, transcriptional repressor for pyruvate dehydrogenase complex